MSWQFMGTSHGLFTCEALLQIWAGNPVRFQGILTAEEKFMIEATDAEWEQVV
jgi:hypothetical protein